MNTRRRGLGRPWPAGLYLCLFLFLMLLVTPASRAATPAALVLRSAESAQGREDDRAPPSGGWEAVKLPDAWAARWPGFNGVVWYRLSWEQPDAAPTGLLMDYLVMAGAVYVNGTLVSRDARLAEPMTRAWNTPRYWLLAAPLLRTGRNDVWVRVSGAAAHQAGLGNFTVGVPAEIERRYRTARLLRHDLQVMSLALCATIVLFFGALWLMRRQATVYGWLALTQALWLVVGSNHVATSPWPFASSDGWQALNSAALLAYSGCFAVFTFRFWQQQHHRTEKALWVIVGMGVLALAAVPVAQLELARAAMALLSVALIWTGCLIFIIKGLASRQTDERMLSLCMSASLAFSAHDLLVFLGVIDSNMYYASMAASLLMAGMAVVLAWRFVASLRQIESFNIDLQATVAAARSELAATLQRQHALEVANARLSERVELARDLHDGLGGTLLGNIAALELQPHRATGSTMLAVLKGLRDDLRLIVENAADHDGSRLLLEDALLPLRRRFADLLQASGMQCVWPVGDLVNVLLPTSRTLDVQRLLQEALTNVLKHSRARVVHVDLQRHGDRLQLRVRDDGVGLEAPHAAGGGGAERQGYGLPSMHARAARLGATLSIETVAGWTQLVADIPLAGLSGQNRFRPAPLPARR